MKGKLSKAITASIVLASALSANTIAFAATTSASATSSASAVSTTSSTTSNTTSSTTITQGATEIQPSGAYTVPLSDFYNQISGLKIPGVSLPALSTNALSQVNQKVADGFTQLIQNQLDVYLTDGANVISISPSQISYDASTQSFTVQHSDLNPYTQYAFVVGPKTPSVPTNKLPDNSYVGVVTSVDTSTGEVSILGHGSIQVPGPANLVAKQYQAGDLVRVNELPNGKQMVMPSPESGRAVLFTTGSAVGEATHVSVSLESASTSVVNGGELVVQATDDYGNPATDATVTVSGVGSGNGSLKSAFSAPATTTITDGVADIQLTDHTAESVNISYTVQDAKYSGQNSQHSGSVTETFTPGETAQIQVTNPATVNAGQDASFSGVAEDEYGNPVVDGTQINVTPQNGTVSNLTTTSDGDFSFTFNTTKSGSDSLAVTGADSGYSTNDSVTVLPGKTAQIQITNPSTVTAGSNASFTGVADDQYGNPVADGTQITETASNGTISDATTTTGGNFSFTLNTTKAGSDTITATAGDSGYSTTDAVTVQAGSPSTATITLPSTLNQGSTATVSGTVSDQYGNPVANAPITFSGSLTGTLTSNSTGQYSGSLTVGASGAVTVKSGSSNVSLTNTSGSSITTITSTPAVTLKPAPSPMEGFMAPTGSWVQASTGYNASGVISGNLNNDGWDAATSGVQDVQVYFPSAQEITGIQLYDAGVYYPETRGYDIYGDENGNWVQIGSASRQIGTSPSLLSPISVAPGSYNGIEVQIVSNSPNAGPSYAALENDEIGQISFLN